MAALLQGTHASGGHSRMVTVGLLRDRIKEALCNYAL